MAAMSLPSVNRGSFTVRQSASLQDRVAQLELRYRVLREPLGMTREQAIFPRDDDDDTVHLVAVVHPVVPGRAESVGGTPSYWRAPTPLRFETHQNVLSNRQAGSGTPGSEGGAPVVIGTATMISHGPDVVQLRGMASDPKWAGCGVGRAVLEMAHELAGSRSLWCDARISARDFYARFGWVAEGEIFDIPQVGPHTVMRYNGG